MSAATSGLCTGTGSKNDFEKHSQNEEDLENGLSCEPEEREKLLGLVRPIEIEKNTHDEENSSQNPEFPSENTNLSTEINAATSPERRNKCPCFTPQFQVYISQFLSSWGDRMWMFAGGLFLIDITPGSLRLVAIYEAAISLTVIILGAAVGRWVDRTSRLKAAQLSLIIQNVMVCACTVVLCLLISYQDYFTHTAKGWGEVILQVVVVILACIAQIGTLGSKLAIEKDWIVVISEENDSRLSAMNSVLRTIDLSTEMMAPVLVGFVMSSSGMVVGGIVIASWNATSLVFEYGLLHNLYYRVLALQRSKGVSSLSTSDGGTPVVNFLKSVKERVKDAAITWKLYFKHDIRDAGLGLAFLFMTVLALDNYSRAYVYENGVSKAVLGILTACASLSGILGSVAFPFLRKRIGVLNTGIFGFVFETLCLIFCLVSVFAPGTYFRPESIFESNTTQPGLNSQNVHPPIPHEQAFRFLNDESYFNLKNDSLEDCTDSFEDCTVPALEGDNQSNNQSNNTSGEVNYTSVSLLLTGIISSRLGLWLADLTVIQILQEGVGESERGGINGVQSSLNQSFSLLRSVLLIILPTVATFGYLIILSFIFVAMATVLFCVYAYKTRKKSQP